ncbi:MAG: triose-phosphate isomerase [Verrucomicrobia bacterium]|nr:triose-phosphate isomerase [Verrucomicrobiota bacterium]MBO4715652.1 triose-phosphate isomerase [Verrucomicrobiota bacterium]MBR5979077.1 triose-phosphate isomerase [Verrucomicrobiota bacterium]MBR6464527.1 triose-phosphate isomerase [Verrucomicrobiota bacterium]
MDKERKLLIAGNWKMNKTVAEAVSLVEGLVRELSNVKEVDILVCPPFTALYAVSQKIIDTQIRLGAQTMNENNYGAYTGEINAGMLKEFSVRYVILGHSERRQYYKEDDALIAKKALAAHAAALKPIICVGETLAQREAGQAEAVIGKQVEGSLAGLSADQMEETVIAYEPVWAIGTGKTATSAQAQEIHQFIRKTLAKMFGEAVAKKVRILYGGSVKPANARELMSQPDVDGGLVGGAALEVRSFSDIVKNSI